MDSILNQVNADRAVFNSLGKIYPADGSVEISGESIEGVTCYWFVPNSFDKNKIVIYLHGGMFVLGSIEGYKAMVSHFASAFSTKILFIEYALAPEKPFPNGVNDILKVYRELIHRYPDAKINLMGDSAGGGLSATLIKMASEEKLKMPSGVALLSPWVYLRGNTESYETRKKLDPILTKDKLMEYAGYYAANHWNEADPGQLTFNSFPPLLILVGSNEILFDDSKLFYEKIKLLQPDTQMKEYENQVHGWPLIDIESDAAKDALTTIEKFITKTSSW
ncbi:MAG TPA: alpha/beta hydrolase [Chitinophagaceae bacterium]|nr:alpha/beta hydrolase [Chitinophagaceae bacterium]